jgi:ATP-dependent Clp protease adaptor protein ClpS
MSTIVAPAEIGVQEPVSDGEIEQGRPWVVIVWNDPINLMSYVTLAFQKLFEYSLQKATRCALTSKTASWSSRTPQPPSPPPA